MPETKGERISLEELKQGDLVWSEHFETYAIFEELSEFQGSMWYWFQRYPNGGVLLIQNSNVYAVNNLLKELL